MPRPAASATHGPTSRPKRRAGGPVPWVARLAAYPHLLRHASATYWANKLPYFKFCKRFGWTMTSGMPQRYIDRAGVDEMDVAMLYHSSQLPGGSEIASPHSQDAAVASLSWSRT